MSERKTNINMEWIMEYHQKIQTIVWNNCIPVKHRKFQYNEIMDKNLLFLGAESLILTEEVDFTKLSVLTDIKTIHKYEYGFKATIAEVIEQIPFELLEKTEAFMFVYIPYGRDDIELFSDEFEQDKSVAILRLYKKREKTDESTPYPGGYPEQNAKLPINMSEEEFLGLKRVLEKRYF